MSVSLFAQLPQYLLHGSVHNIAMTEAVDGLSNIDFSSPRLSALFSNYSRDHFVVGGLLWVRVVMEGARFVHHY